MKLIYYKIDKILSKKVESCDIFRLVEIGLLSYHDDQQLYIAVSFAIPFPKVEYASQVWDAYIKKDIASFERVQRKAVRFCTNNYHSFASVTDMTNDLGWTSLELRRKTSKLILLHQMSRVLINIDVNCHLRPDSSGIRTCASHNCKLIQNKTSKNVYYFS